MSFTKEDLENLNKAIGLGALKTEIGGEKVEYRSLAEMREIRAMMERDISGQPSTGFIETTYES